MIGLVYRPWCFQSLGNHRNINKLTSLPSLVSPHPIQDSAHTG